MSRTPHDNWPYRGGRLGSGWYEETEQDIKYREIQLRDELALKQKLGEIFALHKLVKEEAKNAIEKIFK